MDLRVLLLYFGFQSNIVIFILLLVSLLLWRLGALSCLPLTNPDIVGFYFLALPYFWHCKTFYAPVLSSLSPRRSHFSKGPVFFCFFFYWKLVLETKIQAQGVVIANQVVSFRLLSCHVFWVFSANRAKKYMCVYSYLIIISYTRIILAYIHTYISISICNHLYL